MLLLLNNIVADGFIQILFPVILAHAAGFLHNTVQIQVSYIIIYTIDMGVYINIRKLAEIVFSLYNQSDLFISVV